MFFFSVQGTGGSPMGPDPENREGDQDTGSQGRPVSSGLQVPSEPGHCHAKTTTPWWLSHSIFPSKCSSTHQQRWVIDNLALWKIINEEDAVLIPKNRGEKFSSGFLHSGFLGQGEPLCCHSIDYCFVSWSQWNNQVLSMVTNCDRKSFGSRWKNSKNCSDDWHHWCFWSAFRHFETHFVDSFCMSKSSWMMDPTCLREMPSCSAIDLAEIQGICSWICSIISGVVTVLGCPGWGAWQAEKSPCLNWVTQFLTVAYNDACSPNVSGRMEWTSFGTLPCWEKKIPDDRSCLNVVEIVCITWHASFQSL